MGIMQWVGAPKSMKKAKQLDERRKILNRQLNIKRAEKGLPQFKLKNHGADIASSGGTINNVLTGMRGKGKDYPIGRLNNKSRKPYYPIAKQKTPRYRGYRSS